MAAGGIGVVDFFGRTRVAPAVFGLTEMQRAVAVRLGVLSDVVIFANFPSGQPDKVFSYGSVEELAAYHDADKSNDISVQLARRMLTPFKEPGISGPGIIRTVQVGNHTQSTRLWQSAGPTTKITFTSTVYGLPANKFETKLEAGTVATTAKLSVRKRNDPSTLIVQDNLGLAFTIQYTGLAAAATMTITVASDSATKVELLQDAVVKYTFNTNDPQYDTLNKLINSIDDLTDYTCTLASGADPTMPITFLDAAAAVDIKSAPFLQKALLGSIVYYVNTYLKPSNGTVGYFTAARATGQTTFGTFDTDFVLSTGATNPTVVLQDWRDALEILNTENLDGGYLFPVTTDSSVQSAFIDWSISQYSGRSKTWRMVLGTAAGVTAQQAKDLAFQCNYTRAMVVCQRIQDTNENNVLTDYDPIHYAALMVGGSAGTPITNPLTGKRLNCKGIKDVFSLTTMEDLARFGVTTCFFDRGGAGTSAGFKVLLAVSTDLGEKRMPRIWQDSIAVDHIHNNVLIRMKVFVGQWGDAEKVQQAEMLVATTLDALETARVISRGTDDTGAPLPAYSPPRANLNAGLLSVYWRAYIGGEVDYVGLKGAVDYQTFGLSVAA